VSANANDLGSCGPGLAMTGPAKDAPIRLSSQDVWDEIAYRVTSIRALNIEEGKADELDDRIGIRKRRADEERLLGCRIVDLVIAREIEAAGTSWSGRMSEQSGDAPVSEHPEDTCEECGRPNVVWFAPSDLWNQVMRSGDRGAPDVFGIVCPMCFIRRAEALGVTSTAWRLVSAYRLARKWFGPNATRRTLLAWAKETTDDSCPDWFRIIWGDLSEAERDTRENTCVNEPDFREAAGMLGVAVAALLPFLPDAFPWKEAGQVHVWVTREQWLAAREATEPIRMERVS
jgi:hypothetical protein